MYYQQYSSVKAHARTCQYAHRHCYLCPIPHARNFASRWNARPQGLYLSLAKLWEAFAGAEDFIPCSQTPTCQRCRQCDYSSIGTVSSWANKPWEKTKHNNNQATANDEWGSPWTLLCTNLQYVCQHFPLDDNSVPETLTETKWTAAMSERTDKWQMKESVPRFKWSSTFFSFSINFPDPGDSPWVLQVKQ